MARRLAIVIISGPLGSGKTTFVKHILESSSHLRFAYIKLNVGDVSTDTKLLQSMDKGIHTTQVKRCNTCNLLAKSSSALNRAYERASNLDGVILETAFLSHTAAICNFISTRQSVRERFYLNEVVAVIDPLNLWLCSNGPNGEDLSNDPRDSFDQLGFMDKVVLNKIDDADVKYLDEVKHELKCLHPSITNIIEFHCGKVDNELFDLTNVSAACCKGEIFVTNDSCGDMATLSCVCGEFEGTVNVFLLESWVTEFMKNSTSCIRCKGLLAIPGDKGKVAFQGNGRHVKINLLEQSFKRGDKECTFEFIGGALDQAFIRQRMADCQCTQDLRFSVGDRILANVGSWKSGIVIKLWDMGNPYRIEIDEEECHVFAPEDTDIFVKKNSSRDTTTQPGREELRFKVGDIVYANVGHWALGKILELFDDGNDYRIEIQNDEKTNVFAPVDSDVYVKEMLMD